MTKLNTYILSNQVLDKALIKSNEKNTNVYKIKLIKYLSLRSWTITRLVCKIQWQFNSIQISRIYQFSIFSAYFLKSPFMWPCDTICIFIRWTCSRFWFKWFLVSTNRFCCYSYIICSIYCKVKSQKFPKV